MSDVQDYSTADGDTGNTHYQGVPSSYGKRVDSQNKMQPNYCDPGKADGNMKGEKSNKQTGP